MSNSFENTLQRASTYTRSILRNVYIWMTIALAITGVVAYAVAQNPDLVAAITASNALWILLIAEVVAVFALSAFIMKMSPIVATVVFAGYSVLNGLVLSSVFYFFTLDSIATAFFVTAGTFAIMSVYALTTKRDLSKWGTYLFMGVIGLLISGLVNMFLHSGTLSLITSFVGVIIFTALTAYDTQKIKRMSDALGDRVVEADFIRLSILGALQLYLDFINIFLYLLRFLGVRKD